METIKAILGQPAVWAAISTLVTAALIAFKVKVDPTVIAALLAVLAAAFGVTSIPQVKASLRRNA